MAELSRELVRLFALGELSAVDVQRLAAAAWADGWGRNHRMAKRLRSCGGSGKYPGNMARDVSLAASEYVADAKDAKPYIFKLGDGKDFQMFLPHEILHSLTRDNLPAWCLSEDELQNTPTGELIRKWANHADVQYTGNLSEVLAVGLHYDGVQYTSTMRAGGAKSVQVCSLNVISTTNTENKATRVPLFVLKKARFHKASGGYETLQEIFDVVAWSFRCLLSGQAPTHRHDGTPFTKYDTAVRFTPGSATPVAGRMQMRGAWEALVQFFRFRSYNSDNFCWQCNCTAQPGPLCFADFSPTALHRSTIMSHESYCLKCAAEQSQPSRLFSCPGFQLQHLVVDSMHSADLGAFCDALGGLFYNEVMCKKYYPSKEVGLEALNRQLNQYYRDHPEHKASKITPITMSQIYSRDPKFPT